MGIGGEPFAALKIMPTATDVKTLKPSRYCPEGGWEFASGWNRADIPADWQLKGVLARTLGKNIEPERFAFYKLPDGRVAEVSYHYMNGPDDLSVSVGTVQQQRDRWAELTEGQKWEERNYLGYGRYDNRSGRYRKAYRVA